TRSYSYNFTTGTRLSEIDPNGHATNYTYDILARTTRITYPTGDYTPYAYNDAANYVNITNENGWKTQQIYDGLGRLATTERFLGNAIYSTETYTYNWQDKTTAQKDPVGNIYSYQYDGLGRITLT